MSGRFIRVTSAILSLSLILYLSTFINENTSNVPEKTLQLSMNKKILIMSATSEIAQQLAKLYVSHGTTLLLHGRDPNKLAQVAAELRKTHPKADIVELPPFDLIYPSHTDVSKITANSLLDECYIRWFDDIVKAYGLPQYMFIAGGGAAKCASATVELNAVSAMKCCEQFIRKIRANVHNDKYRNKRFRILYISSVGGEAFERSYGANGDENSLSSLHYAYCYSKHIMNLYLDDLRIRVKDLNLSIHNSKLGPVDTSMLRGGLKQVTQTIKQAQGIDKYLIKVWLWLTDQTKITAESAAMELKDAIDSDERTFWTPKWLQYWFLFVGALMWIPKFIWQGLIFSCIFVAPWRNKIIETFLRFTFWS